jgi:hypothetical protein
MEANRQALTGYDGFAVHAAVFASPRRVAVVPGESGTGKTTLTAAAVMAGLAYGSDEALCVDRESEAIVPYPKPLGLSLHSQRLLGLTPTATYSETEEAPVPITDLGGVAMGPGRVLTDIFIPIRTADADPRIEPLSPATAVAGLLENSFNHYRDPKGSYLLTAHLAAQARTWAFTYSDPRAAGRDLAEFLR